MIRLFSIFIIMIFPILTYAGCGGGLRGTSANGNEFYIGQGDCDYPETMIVFSSAGSKALYKFYSECDYTRDEDQVTTGFSCQISGKSPLAGSVYKLRELKNVKGYCPEDDWVEFYTCEKGCSSKIPKTFNIEYEECGG